jgi:N-acetylmuramoyl-L-alanine amidase
MAMQSINFGFYNIIILFATILLNTNAFSQEFIRVVDSNGTEILNVQSISLEDNQYLLISNLLKIFKAFDERQKVKIFDAKQRYIPLTQKLTLEFKDNKKISLVINQTTVTIEGRESTTESLETSSAEFYTLSKPPALISNIPALPIEFLTQILSKVLEIEIEFDKNIQTLWIRLKTSDTVLEEPIKPLKKRSGEFLVIIDAGHGGNDVGAKSPTGLLEKNLTLEIAQKVRQLCVENGITVYLTRESDKFLTLQQRASIANMSYGDLFISIHLNASFSKNQSGFTIYVNNPAGRLKFTDEKTKSETNVDGGNRKTDSSVNEVNAPTTTSSQSSQLVKKVSQLDFIEQSRKLAENLFFELTSSGLVGKPPIEIPLATLNRVYMPAVLLEVGYISNASDDAKLSDPKSIETITQALLRTVQKFNNRINYPADK